MTPKIFKKSPRRVLRGSGWKYFGRRRMDVQRETMFSKKTCCIVTGASQGLGACTAEHFINQLSEDSVVIRLSRNVQKMEAKQYSNPSVKTVLCAKYDQSNIDEKYFSSLLIDIFKRKCIKATDFQQAIMVHNAGDLGDISKFTSEMSDATVVKQCFDVNCTGTVLLNAAFMKLFPDDAACERIIINISSLAAIQPFKSLSLYSSCKAARLMFFRTVAMEFPRTRVLSYSPGSCDTDMQQRCRIETVDKDLLSYFETIHKEGKLLSCDTTISKMMDILQQNKYKSGDHVDYYDEL